MTFRLHKTAPNAVITHPKLGDWNRIVNIQEMSRCSTPMSAVTSGPHDER